MIDLCDKLGKKIIENAEDMRFKKKLTYGRMDDMNRALKKRFDMVDTKLEKENKKMRENMMKQHDEGKSSNALVQNANLKMS